MAEAPTNRGQVDRFVQYDLFGGRSRAASFCAGLEDIANLNGLRLRTPFDRGTGRPFPAPNIASRFEEMVMKTRSVRLVLAAFALCAGVLLASFTLVAQPPNTLYDRLGGKPAIAAVVDEFVARVAADKRINSFFAGLASDPSRLAAFKGKLVDQICEASGGPCKYTGKDMSSAHEGMGITEADFNALVEDLVGALDKCKVAAQDQQTLLGVLGPMKKDIVGK